MPDEQEVLDGVYARADALGRADAEGLRRLLHPRFGWTSHRGEAFDLESYIANNAGGAVIWRRQSLREVSAVVVGDAAVVTAIATDDVTQAGAELTFTMRMTQTWVRVDGRWLCLAGHAGPLLPSGANRPVFVADEAGRPPPWRRN